MALFGSSKITTKSTTIKPTVVRTQNVAKEIQKIATAHKIDVNLVDFNLIEIFTYMRIIDKEQDGEWEGIDKHDLYELDETETLLNPYVEIKQTYEIEIFSGRAADNYFSDFKFAIGANASKCKVYMSIAAGSRIEEADNLNENLTDIINKRKIRAGILINIFDEMLLDVVSKLSAQIKVDGSAAFEKKETLLIAEAFEPTPTRDDALILHYENAKTIDEKEKIDYASRGFIQSVKENELLIEYIKPMQGTPGRNCRGEYLVPREPVVAHEVAFAIDETIRQEEDSLSVKYIAKENGYIAFNDNIYSIKNKMDINEISFKKTGSILSGVDSDVNLSVNEKDVNKDAIGSGMQVEVSEIVIDGNVGSNSSVKALKASVGGQTHKTSFIEADKLDINIHKGKAKGKEVHITRLEHGEVEADSVTIMQALGGSIRAKDVYVEVCASHVKVTAAQRIEINKLQGSENIFIIDPLLQEDKQEGLNKNQENIQELESIVKSIRSEMKKLELSIKKGTHSFLDIKKRLVHYKKNGVKLPAAFVQKYKAFMKLQDDLKELKSEYKLKNDTLLLHTTQTSSFQDNILDARVINRDRWVGYNEIKFKLIDPPEELVYKPAEGSRDMIFGLVQDEEGEYSIKAMKE